MRRATSLLGRRRDPAIYSPTHRLIAVWGPLIVVATVATAASAVTALIGWHRTEVLIAAAVIAAAVLVFVTTLLYRQDAEQRAARRTLRDVEVRVGDVLNSAMDAIIVVDHQQRVVLFNDAAEQVFRWSRTAVLGQTLDVLLPARFRAIHRQHVQQFGETGASSRRMGAKMVLTGLRADGEEFPIEASISQFGEDSQRLYTVILRDITERMRTEGSLARSEARLRGILDSAMDAIVTVDQRQHIVLFNAAAEAVFGCPQKEAIGAPLAGFIPERFRAEHAGHIRRFGETVTDSRRMATQRIVTGLRRNGEEFPIDASISQISEGDQKFYTVILRDVTTRVKADEALRRSKEELFEFATAANHLREQERRKIARELHDELAQALTGLKMDISWIKGKLRAPPAIAEKLDTMETLLDGTVAATRRISSDLRPMMLDDLGLVPAIEWLTQSFSERTEIRCKLAIADPEMDLQDPHATTIYRVLQESLTNVAKHARASTVEVTLERADGEVALTVRDDGVGFSLENSRKPSSYGIIGMRERIYLVGGKVLIVSAPGDGTRIEFRLPLPESAR
jgi:PAS domain S-box-containing protein